MANGDSYRGYMSNGFKHGYGVWESSFKNQQFVYIGGWKIGIRHGYGVISDSRKHFSNC